MIQHVLLVLVLATTACAGVAQPIGDFDLYQEDWVFGNGPEFPGAKGSVRIEGGQAAKAGPGALRLEADFSNGGRYVQVLRSFDGLAMASLTGWVRSENVSSLGFRILDSTNQVFQTRNAYALPDGKWQKLNITVEELTKSEHWGGANDGVWHGPMKQMSISIGSDGLNGKSTSGTVWLDGLAAVLTAKSPQPVPSGAAKLMTIDPCDNGIGNWSFVAGEEFPGAKGAVSTERTDPKSGKGCLRMEINLSEGGNYVAVHRSLADQELDVRELRVWIRRSDVGAIGVRLIDGSGQCHQMPAGGLQLNANDAWQEVVIQVPAVIGGEHWGGANDGAWHPPLKGVSFVVGVAGVGIKRKGTVWFDELRGVVLAQPKH